MADSKGGPVYTGLRKIPDRVLLIFAGLVYLFLYAPIMVLIFFSFNSTKNTQVWTGFSTQWYGELIRDSSVLNAFKLSLMVGLTATAVATRESVSRAPSGSSIACRERPSVSSGESKPACLAQSSKSS